MPYTIKTIILLKRIHNPRQINHQNHRIHYQTNCQIHYQIHYQMN